MTSTRNALSYHMRDSAQAHFAHFQGPLRVAKPEMAPFPLTIAQRTRNPLRKLPCEPMDRNNIGTRHGFTAI
jgi:hypothetical protein